MKKIINGKVYNTETAKRVGAWDNGHFTSDHEYCSEDLYQKKNGEFFLHGEGGAMSKYATSYGDGIGYGNFIIPMSYDEAAKWAERHMSTEEYEAVFGEVAEDDTLVHLHISMSATSADKIRKSAAREGLTISEYIAKKCAE